MFEEPRVNWNGAVASAPAAVRPNNAPSPVSLVLASLARHWLLTLMCGLLGLALAFAFTQVVRPRFEASAQLLVDPRDLVVLDKEVTPRSSNNDSGVAVVESQARVLQSDVVLRKAITTAKLEDDPEFNGTRKGLLMDTLAKVFKYEPTETADEANDPNLSALRALRKRVFVKRSERTFVVDLNVWSETREKSVAIADAIIKAYLAEQASARSDPARTAGDAIDAGIDSLRQKLAASENLVSKYKTDKNLVGASGKLVTEQQLTEINNQLLLARSDLGRAKAKNDEAKRLRTTPDAIPEALNSASLRQLRGQLSAIVSQKARLSAQLQPRHPVMVQVLEQERQVQGEIRQELQRVISSAAIEFDRATAVEKALAADLETVRSQMNAANAAQIKLRELEGELEANRAVYQAAIVRARETRQQASLNTTNVRVIAEPSPAKERMFPPSNAVIVPLGLILGLGAGAFLGLLRDAVGWRAPAVTPPAVQPSPEVPTADPVSKRLPVDPRPPAGASITLVPTRRPVPGRDANTIRPASTIDDPPFTFTNLRGSVVGGAVAAGSLATRNGNGSLGATPEEEALAVFDLASQVVETPNAGVGRKLNRLSAHLESIRTGTAVSGSPPHVLIVTSDQRNPMASVVALGLAYALNARRKRVLLVDADVDEHSLSAALPKGRSGGTQDVMSGLAPLTVALVKQPTSSDATAFPFDCLPMVTRTLKTNRSRVNQQSLRRILTQATAYDVVIIKAPALDQPSVDATFSNVACQVLLAMRVAPASEDVLMGALRTLRKAVPKFCGLVITD